MSRAETAYHYEQRKRGELYQDFIYELLHHYGISTVAYCSKVFQQQIGENKAGIEIKFDDKLAKTGNLWIEIAEKADPLNASYVTSGIYRDCVEYVIGNYDEVYRFATTWLRRIWESGKYRVIENNMKSGRGFLLPREVAVRSATQILRPNCSGQMANIIAAYAESRPALQRETAALLDQITLCDPRQFSLFSEDNRPHA